MPDWIERPYGWRMPTGENSQILRIRPGHHTGMGAPPERTGPHDLKSNYVIWEHVLHLGAIDQSDNDEFSLVYRFLPQDHQGEAPVELKFRKNGRFYSVVPDDRRTGYYHNLYNVSDHIIDLAVEWEPSNK